MEQNAFGLAGPTPLTPTLATDHHHQTSTTVAISPPPLLPPSINGVMHHNSADTLTSPKSPSMCVLLLQESLSQRAGKVSKWHRLCKGKINAREFAQLVEPLLCGIGLGWVSGMGCAGIGRCVDQSETFSWGRCAGSERGRDSAVWQRVQAYRQDAADDWAHLARTGKYACHAREAAIRQLSRQLCAQQV